MLIQSIQSHHKCLQRLDRAVVDALLPRELGIGEHEVCGTCDVSLSPATQLMIQEEGKDCQSSP